MKRLTWFMVVFFSLGLVAAHAMAPKPTDKNFTDPTITLEQFEVPQYDGFWYYGNKIKPTKGKADNRGAPLSMSFLLAVENPNPYPVQVEGLKFTVRVEDEFDLVTVNSDDTYWIPAKCTDHIRLTTMITVRSSLLNLGVTGGFKLKEKGIGLWEALEKWWVGIADYSIPLKLAEGVAIFNADEFTKVVGFDTEFSAD